jgi:hypothetical protein
MYETTIFKRHSFDLQKIAVYEGVINGLDNLLITNLIKQNIVKVNCNVFADRTDWDFHTKAKEIFDIAKHVSDICSSVTKTEFNCDLSYQVTSCWGAIYTKNSYAQEHDHFPNVFSCVIYIKVNDDSSPIIFENEKLVLHPKNNSILIFPGILRHNVPVVNTNDERVVLAFNLTNIN